MKWEKCSAKLSDILAAGMAIIPAQRRVMFGCPAYFINGNMFAGVHGSGIFLRLTEADRRKFIDKYDEASLFEPVPGHAMKEYVLVPAAVYDHPETFSVWLDKAFTSTAALPPKSPKLRSKK